MPLLRLAGGASCWVFSAGVFPTAATSFRGMLSRMTLLTSVLCFTMAFKSSAVKAKGGKAATSASAGTDLLASCWFTHARALAAQDSKLFRILLQDSCTPSGTRSKCFCARCQTRPKDVALLCRGPMALAARLLCVKLVARIFFCVAALLFSSLGCFLTPLALAGLATPSPRQSSCLSSSLRAAPVPARANPFSQRCHSMSRFDLHLVDRAAIFFTVLARHPLDSFFGPSLFGPNFKRQLLSVYLSFVSEDTSCGHCCDK